MAASATIAWLFPLPSPQLLSLSRPSHPRLALGATCPTLHQRMIGKYHLQFPLSPALLCGSSTHPGTLCLLFYKPCVAPGHGVSCLKEKSATKRTNLNSRVTAVRRSTPFTQSFTQPVPAGFNEDTFATDSLHQIISLLSSLDAHAFSLVASLSFNGQSRTKDLWVFIGPGSADFHDSNRPVSSTSQSGSLDIRRSNRASTPDQGSNPDAATLPPSLHRRAATAPQYSAAHMFSHSPSPSGSHYVRPGTEPNPVQPVYPTTLSLTPRAVPGNGLRKLPPRVQLPNSIDIDVHEEDGRERYRTSLASVVPSSCENMTGIGTQSRHRFNSNTTPADTSGGSGEPDHDDEETVHAQQSSPRRVSVLRPVSTRSKTPPLLTSHTRDPRTHPVSTPNESPAGIAQTQDPVTLGESPPLLSPGMFRVRDSAFSANSIATAGSCDPPIKWSAALGRPEGIGAIEEETDQYHEGPRLGYSSPPTLPGAWATSIEEEQAAESGEADNSATRLQLGRNPDRSLHDVDARVTSPEVVREDVVRHSEAGMIGVIPPPQSRPALSPLPRPSKESLGRARLGGSDPPASPTKTGSRSGSADRWVFVNLEGNNNHHVSSPLASPTTQQAGEKGRRSSAHITQNGRGSSLAEGHTASGPKEMKGARGKAGGSGLRRLLSFGSGASRSGRFRNKLTRNGATESPASKPPERVRIKLD